MGGGGGECFQDAENRMLLPSVLTSLSLMVAFQDGYCLFSIKNPLNPLSFCFKFGQAGPGIFTYLFLIF